MEYYKMDEVELRIRRIKNLKSIHAFFLQNQEKFVLSVTTETDNITVDNHHPHFMLFLTSLANAYFDECDTRRILVLNPDVISLLKENKQNQITRSSFIPVEKIEYQSNELRFFTTFIYEALAVVFGCNGVEITRFSPMKGMRTFFHMFAETKGNTYILPIKYSKKSENKIVLEIGNVVGTSLHLEIRYSPSGVRIYFHGGSIPLVGTIIYELDQEPTHEVEVMYENQMSFYNRESLVGEEMNGKMAYSLSPEFTILYQEEESTKDTEYRLETKEFKKCVHLKEKWRFIGEIKCPVYTDYEGYEEYKIGNNFSLVQKYNIDNQYSIDDIHLILKEGEKEIVPPKGMTEELKSLDERVIRLRLERKE